MLIKTLRFNHNINYVHLFYMFDIPQNFTYIGLFLIILFSVLYFFINYQVSTSIAKQFNILNKKKYKKLNHDNRRMAKLRKLQAQREIVDSYVDPNEDNEDEIINDDDIMNEDVDNNMIEEEEEYDDEENNKKYRNKKRLSKHDVLQRDLIR